ncbi:MAG: pantetheine-phosphate adenylyltransferase [Hadesarchaea archaeon]|nr:pantetheine-phosphate adenylyltransferase [Hadesarchaea archaeon]
MKYDKVAVGGTFDYLHDGHKAILSKAFNLGNQVLIGIVSDKMELRKDSAGIQPLEDRKTKLENFLREKGWIERSEILVISDPIGPAADDEELEAIVVSEETRAKAEKINEVRESKGLDTLEIVEIPWVLADDGKPVSSIRIRYEEMDEHGNIKKSEKEISDAG